MSNCFYTNFSVCRSRNLSRVSLNKAPADVCCIFICQCVPEVYMYLRRTTLTRWPSIVLYCIKLYWTVQLQVVLSSKCWAVADYLFWGMADKTDEYTLNKQCAWLLKSSFTSGYVTCNGHIPWTSVWQLFAGLLVWSAFETSVWLFLVT